MSPHSTAAVRCPEGAYMQVAPHLTTSHSGEIKPFYVLILQFFKGMFCDFAVLFTWVTPSGMRNEINFGS